MSSDDFIPMVFGAVLGVGAVALWSYFKPKNLNDINIETLRELKKAQVSHMYFDTGCARTHQILMEEIERLEKEVLKTPAKKVIKCLICNSTSYSKVCDDCIVPSVMEFHTKAKFELNL